MNEQAKECEVVTRHRVSQPELTRIYHFAALTCAMLVAGCGPSAGVKALSFSQGEDGESKPLKLTIDGIERQWIEGGRSSHATFHLEHLTEEQFSEVIPVSLRFEVLRPAYMGMIEEYPLLFELKNPQSGFITGGLIYRAPPFTGANLRILTATGQSHPYAISDPRYMVDVFEKIVHNGEAELLVRTLTKPELLGLELGDLKIGAQTAETDNDDAIYEVSGDLLTAAVEASRQAWKDYESHIQDVEYHGQRRAFAPWTQEYRIWRKWHATMRPRIQDAEKVARDRPDTKAADQARYQLAIVHLLANDSEKAIAFLKRVRNSDTKCLAALQFLRGMQLYDDGKLLDALTEINKAIELDTNNAWAYEHRMFIAEQLDEPYAAGDLERREELEPKVDGVRRTLPWLVAPPVCDEIRKLTRVVPNPSPEADGL